MLKQALCTPLMNCTFSLFYSQTQSFLLFPNCHFCSVTCLQMTSLCCSFICWNCFQSTRPMFFGGPFFPPAVGRAMGKAGRSRCLGKSPKCIQIEATMKENMHSQLFAFLILPFKRRAMFLLCHLLRLHSLFVLHSKLSPFLLLLSQKCCSFHLVVLQDPV